MSDALVLIPRADLLGPPRRSSYYAFRHELLANAQQEAMPCRAFDIRSRLRRSCHATHALMVGSDVLLKHMGELSSITLAVRAGGKQLRMSRYKRWLSSRGLSTVLSWPLHGVRCSRGLSTGLRGSASPPFALAAYRIIYGELCMKDGHVSEGL